MTSNGTVPSGLQFYEFEYPDVWRDGGDKGPAECFLENDTEAAEFAKRHGASKAIHAVSGRVILQSQ